MHKINFSADELVFALLNLKQEQDVCILDSCGVNHLNSHLLIAGICPVETLQITNKNPNKTLKTLDEKLSRRHLASIFTISYDFGLKLENIKPRKKEFPAFDEPDFFLAFFDCLIFHDYNFYKTYLVGNEKKFDEIEKILYESFNDGAKRANIKPKFAAQVSSNFTRKSYIAAIEKIKEYIRQGDTYQVNLTQQLRAELPKNLMPQEIFQRLRKEHSAPFAAFLKRENNLVLSISPERFIKVQNPKSKVQSRVIETSPIKGTRPRGNTPAEDLNLRKELLSSEKDHAENVMIVDLLRNDIGRICQFGSVEVVKLCDLEEHPTLFHLVSTIKGELRENLKFSDIIRAVFPCGSITGAPKIRTMQIIDELETATRGLSMGAIGYLIPDSRFQIPDSETFNSFDMNVAIRTMVIRGRKAIFNVGGGITINSVPDDEFEESLLKAKALLIALGADVQNEML
ncbi:MAG: aminodeoxychorismate synthase component I [Acidobacteriota bacterium]|nr:aminodeoxychorismate synthase component I [Acidobacteriota bacterium]